MLTFLMFGPFGRNQPTWFRLLHWTVSVYKPKAEASGGGGAASGVVKLRAQ